MTREEAIDELKYIKESFAQCELSHEALDMAIKALEETPKISRRYISTGFLPTVRCQNVEWTVMRNDIRHK